MSAYPNLTASDLRPGDICLMMSSGELSKLITWVGDCPYSHAFLIYDEHQLVEAALSGIRLYPTAERLADRDEVLLLDVYRPSNAHGAAFSSQDVAAMQRTAQTYIGRPYARNALVEIALMSALRNMLPDSETLRWVLRIAMSHYLKDDPSQMVCSELVYRILQEAIPTAVTLSDETLPAAPGLSVANAINGRTDSALASLRPTIISAFRSHAALPPINIKALMEELEAIFKPAPNNAENTARNPQVPLTNARIAYENEAPKGEDLFALSNAIRAKHLNPLASAPVLIVPDPNPKTVFPVDLATSPSLRFIGRMLLG